jgi:hypothetical protein
VALTIDCPDGHPAFLAPGVLNPFTVQIDNAMENYVPGTAELHYRYDSGDFQVRALTPLGGDRFEALLPVAACSAQPEYYLSAIGDDGTAVLSPPPGPAAPWTAQMGTLLAAFQDNFESDQGWTVQNVNLFTGAWERGIPIGGGVRGDPPTDYDGSGKCYVTGNCAGDCDVDGGPTRLISPTFNLADGRYYQFSYARWFYNDNHDEDRLTVEISNDDGGSWTTVETVPHTIGWVYRTFNVNDFVTATAQVKLRFSAIDNPSDSVTEAALDAFLIAGLSCTPPDGTGDLNCDGLLNFGDINPFVMALSDPDEYAALYPGCPLVNRDINNDGQFNFGDINPFVTLFSR